MRSPRPGVLTFRRIIVTTLLTGAVVAGALFGVFLAYESDLPQVTSLEDFQPNIITQVFAADGSVLGEFAIEKRVVVGFMVILLAGRQGLIGEISSRLFDDKLVFAYGMGGLFMGYL